MSDLQAVLTSASAREEEARPSDYLHTLPILVLFPHNRCNCRCMMCDIWRIRQVRELTVDDLAPHLDSLRALKVRWVVFSGGEPLMHSDLGALSRILRREGIRLTLLTAGLLLESLASLVADSFDDVIVSLDGPAEIHNRIRRVAEAFERLQGGMNALRKRRADIQVRGRCTVQKANYQSLLETVKAAKFLRLNSLSFLAADLTSDAFNRPQGWSRDRQVAVALDAEEVEKLAAEIEALISECHEEIETGFVVETPEKLRRMVQHFRAHLGQTQSVAPRCNAPWVSAVIEADGTVRPCFFHRPLGNIHEASLHEILNGAEAVRFRRQLDVSLNPICQKCVCSLHLDRGGLD